MTTKHEKPVCRHCKSDDVGRGASARWDVAKQEWVLSRAFDGAWCAWCDDETELEWVKA
jgi:hypothetical protein